MAVMPDLIGDCNMGGVYGIEIFGRMEDSVRAGN